MVNKENFFLNTQALFLQCTKRTDTPDFVSPIGSRYWFTEEGVYRQSNHWGFVGTCKWFVTRPRCLPRGSGSDVYTGFCRWDEFHSATDFTDISFGYRTMPYLGSSCDKPFYEVDAQDKDLYGWCDPKAVRAFTAKHLVEIDARVAKWQPPQT